MTVKDIIKITIVNPEGISGDISHKIQLFKNGKITYQTTYRGYSKFQRFLNSIVLNRFFSSKQNIKSLNTDGSLFQQLLTELDKDMLNSLRNKLTKSGNQKVEFTDTYNSQKTFIQWTYPEMQRKLTDVETYFQNYIQKLFHSIQNLLETIN